MPECLVQAGKNPEQTEKSCLTAEAVVVYVYLVVWVTSFLLLLFLLVPFRTYFDSMVNSKPFPYLHTQVIASDMNDVLNSSYHADFNCLAGITGSEKPQNSPNFYQNSQKYRRFYLVPITSSGAL